MCCARLTGDMDVPVRTEGGRTRGDKSVSPARDVRTAGNHCTNESELVVIEGVGPDG